MAVVSFSAVTRSGREACRVGAKPNSNVVAKTDASGRASMFPPAEYGDKNAGRNRAVQNASVNPIAAPNAASTKLSVNIWRMSRRRLPPKAIRNAISFRRDAARASSRFATFAQAINSTTATVAMRMASDD